ncbi:MAG: PHP domain-containing protein [Sphaerochaetaceae bacterium]
MRVCFDLHNHSCLSPCGSPLMLPSVLAIEAMDRGIDILALTDHNSARNLPPFAEACDIAGIVGIFGLEVNTSEEVHVLALFEQLESALDFGRFIEFLLPGIQNQASLFGEQTIVDINGDKIGEYGKSLFSAADIDFGDLVEEVLSRDGLVIPAHIDRPSNSVIANLGFLPDLPYSAVESIVVPSRYGIYNNTLIQGSDAHYIEYIGRRSCFAEVSERSFQGLKQALSIKAISYRNQ